jgi:hypothetical protein
MESSGRGQAPSTGKADDRKSGSIRLSSPRTKEIDMNKNPLLGLTLAISALAGAAQAQDGPTRTQVVAETRAAQAAGAIPHGDLDISSSNPRGDIHPAQSALSTLSRAQVKTELTEAITDGTIPLGEIGFTAAELHRSGNPGVPVPGLTREQVRRELAMAQRDGEIPFGEIGLTPAQQNPTRYAKARAQDGLGQYASK